jgi:hypothetical protein
MTLIDLLIVVLCSYRLTQLVVYDGVSEPVTSWLSSLHHKLDEFLCCPHCVGFWASVASIVLMVGSNYWTPLRYGLWALAVAGAVSLIEHGTDWLSPEVPPVPLPEMDIDQRTGYVRNEQRVSHGVRYGKSAASDAVETAVKAMGLKMYTLHHPTRGDVTMIKEE